MSGTEVVLFPLSWMPLLVNLLYEFRPEKTKIVVTVLFGCFPLCTYYFSWDMKHAISATWLASPNRDSSSHLPHTFWSSYKYLIYYRSEDSLAHLVWSYRSSPNPLNLEWVVNFELCSPISCKYMFFCCPFLASHLIL